MEPAAITANGKFQGAARPRWSDGFEPGIYEGAFYGPAGAGMETACTWRVNTDPWDHHILSVDAIIGSFGAVCEGTCRPAPAPSP